MSKKRVLNKVLTEGKLAAKYHSTRADLIAQSPQFQFRLPSRIIPLNYQMNGGIPFGKILELFGPESSGKSALAMDFAYATQALGGEVAWADAENCFNPQWFKKNGIELDRLQLLTEENAIEVISDWCLDTLLMLRNRLVANEPILFVLDSIAAVDTVDNMGVSHQDKRAEMGKRAGKIYEFLRLRNNEFSKLGASVILINQLRSKVGASQYEDPDTTPGGKATRFYASQRLAIFPGKQVKEKIKGKEIKIGHNVYIRTKKDKTGPPREKTETQLIFRPLGGYSLGFDKYRGLPELLVSKGVIVRKKGSSRYYLGEKMIAHGEEKMLEVISSDGDLRKKLVKLAHINTISKTSELLSTAGKNYFPVSKGKSISSDEESDE